MKRQLLALVGAAALVAPVLVAGPAQADDAPGAPTIPTAIQGFQRGEVILNWGPPNPSNGLVGYQVRYSSNDGGDWSDEINTGSSSNGYTVAGLDVRQYYVFQVRAFNGGTPTQPAPDSWGPWSLKNTVPVQPAQSVGPPSEIVTISGNASATLTWDEPSVGAKQYQVQYSTNRNGPWQPTLTTPWDHIEITGLTNGTTYYFQVRSFNSDADKSEWVPAPNPATPTGGTNAPTNVQAVGDNAKATVIWTAPTPTPDRYLVQYRIAGGTTPWISAPNATGTSTTVTGLTNGTSYVFQVAAVKDGQQSAWATSNAATPHPASTPLPPTSVSAYGTDSAAVVSWTMPAGQPVTTYLLQYSLNNSQWFPATPVSTGRTDQTFILGGLTNGQAYYIRVAAASGSLASNYTQMPGTVTPIAVPGPPQLLTGTPGNASVALNWRAPIIVGATSPVTGYRVQYSSNNGATWASAPDVAAPAIATTVTGLANGVGYIFRVKATSNVGDGPWSATTGTITPPGGSNPPTNVTAVPGNARATVTWTAPGGSGSPVIGYRVTSAPGGLTCTTSAVPPSVPATTCAVTGLTNGQPYTFTVVAVTGAGTSPASAPSAAVTPAGPSVSIRITDSGRNGRQVFANGATQGLTSGTTVTALVRNKAGASFRPAGQVAVQDDGTFSWSTNIGKKTWVRFTSGGITSNTVIIGAR